MFFCSLEELVFSREPLKTAEFLESRKKDVYNGKGFHT